MSKEISKLLKSGALLKVNESDLTVCSPLGVTRNACGKQRLILDLSYVNQHLRVSKFKYEDIRTACYLCSKGDWFFKFDYTSGYHHVEIHPGHTTFLGCSWSINGKEIYFKFTVLPFGPAIARIAGCLVSMGLTLGPVVRLWTRECDHIVQSCDSWDKKRALPEGAHKEIQFWSENFENDGQPIWQVSPKVDILTFSDASNIAWVGGGGNAVQLGDQKAVGSWSAEESVKSSTFQEIKAARLVLGSLAPQLVGKEIKHQTDNQGTERIMSVGSNISELGLFQTSNFACIEFNSH